MLGASARTQPRTLSQVAFPQQTLLRDALLVLGAALFLAASAQVSIVLPLGFVPITGQTFAVLLIGGTMGSRLGSMSALLYVAMGIVGLPVYASGFSGWSTIVGASGGYLLSYPLSTWLIGRLAEHGWDRRPSTMATAMLLGSLVIYAIGLPWLYAWGALNPNLSGVSPMTVGLTLEWGLIPFILGDLAKLLLAAGLVPSVWQILHALGVRTGEAGRARPRGSRAAPLAAIASVAMIAGVSVPWTPEQMGIAGIVTIAAGLLGLAGAVLRMRGMLGTAVSQLTGFTAAAAGGLSAFVNLLTNSAAGELALVDFSAGVVVCAIASIVLFASTAMEAAAE